MAITRLGTSKYLKGRKDNIQKTMEGTASMKKVLNEPLSTPIESCITNIATTRPGPILKKSEEFRFKIIQMIFVTSTEINRKCGFNPVTKPTPIVNINIKGVAAIPARIDLITSFMILKVVL
jgi:hypothetical protein